VITKNYFEENKWEIIKTNEQCIFCKEKLLKSNPSVFKKTCPKCNTAFGSMVGCFEFRLFNHKFIFDIQISETHLVISKNYKYFYLNGKVKDMIRYDSSLSRMYFRK